ncbi:MAG: hypothetical protein IJ447_06920 [Clostridia bacterium]|nr:hypothetical protein [Clostridia bacterium]
MKGLGILAIGIADVLLWVPFVFPWLELFKGKANFKKILKLSLIALAIYSLALLLFHFLGVPGLKEASLERMVLTALMPVATVILKAILKAIKSKG